MFDYILNINYIYYEKAFFYPPYHRDALRLQQAKRVARIANSSI